MHFMIHFSAKNLQTIRLVLSFTGFYNTVCRTGRRPCSFQLSLICSDNTVVGNTNGTIQTAFSVHIIVRSSFWLYISGASRWWCCRVCECYDFVVIIITMPPPPPPPPLLSPHSFMEFYHILGMNKNINIYRRTEGRHSPTKCKAHDRTKYDLYPHFKGLVQVRGPMKCFVTS
jgi:hypothetical protein